MRSAAKIAEAIREHFDPDYAQKVHPDLQHLNNIAVEVAKHLDVEPSPLMINQLVGLIQQHVDRPSAEYPKMLYNHGKRMEREVKDAQEEHELGPDWVDYHWKAPGPISTAEDHHQELDQDGSEESPSRH
jgi:hypothetical protein